MKITWYGHSCFKIKGREGAVVIDPYGKDCVPGLELKDVKSDVVMCTHEHEDHGALDEVLLSTEDIEIPVRYISSYHDKTEGSERGDNRIIVLEVNEEKIVHLGDLGHELDNKTLKEIGKVDILLVPVGGHYTIDSKEALNIVKTLKPRITIPMHYRDDKLKCDYPELSTVDEFRKAFKNIVEVGSEFYTCDIEGEATVIMTPDCFTEKELS